jgi:hypothetical protein
MPGELPGRDMGIRIEREDRRGMKFVLAKRDGQGGAAGRGQHRRQREDAR